MRQGTHQLQIGMAQVTAPATGIKPAEARLWQRSARLRAAVLRAAPGALWSCLSVGLFAGSWEACWRLGWAVWGGGWRMGGVRVGIFGLGIGNKAASFMVVIALVFHMILATITQIDGVNGNFINVARTMGATKRQIYVRVIIPAILPQLL